MIAKKNSRHDLEKKRIVLFQIGLLTASSFTLAAFTYKAPTEIETEKNKVAVHQVSFQTELVQKPKIENKIVRQPQTNQQQQTTVDLNVNPNENTNSKENSNEAPDPNKLGFESLGYKFGEEVFIAGEVEIEEEVFEFVDKDATYIGGRPAMQLYINDNVVYPEEARMFGDEGTVYVSFVVEKDGSVSNVEIERGVTGALDREAKRVVRSFPKWNPAELKFANVRARIRLPIVFSLGEE
jgi:protein TonB